MQITSLLSYTQQLKELLNLVFLLILCSQTYPDVAKASTHQYMYTLYRSPAPFYECFITVVIALLRISLSLSGTQFVIFSVNGLIFVFSFPITLFFLLLPFVLFVFNLLYFHFSSSFETSLYTFSFLLLLHLFSLSTFFLGKDPITLLSVLFFSALFSCFLQSLSLLFCASYLSCFYSFSFSVFQQFSFLYTIHVPFQSVLTSPFCAFFLIILYFIFLSLYLCQLILLTHRIFLTFYCIYFPFLLFCSSSFLYTVTIFSQSFPFSSNRLYVLSPS